MGDGCRKRVGRVRKFAGKPSRVTERVKKTCLIFGPMHIIRQCAYCNVRNFADICTSCNQSHRPLRLRRRPPHRAIRCRPPCLPSSAPCLSNSAAPAHRRPSVDLRLTLPLS